MDRFLLTDPQWEKAAWLCLSKPTDPGRTCGDSRWFTEAVLRICAHRQPVA